MRRALWVGIICAGSVGVGMAACGGSGTSNTSSTAGLGGSGGAQHGASTTGSTASNGSVGGGLGFDSGPGDSGSADSDACGSVAIVSHLTPGTIMVVFDQSSSMAQSFADPTGDAGATGLKWQVAEDALVTSVTPLKNLLQLGAVFFPTAKPCIVAPFDMAPQITIEPGPMFLTDFQAHFSDPAWKVIGTTPLHDGIVQAQTALPGPAPAVGQRAVVVLTDGAPSPTCAGPTQPEIVAPVTEMAGRGIKTYAIGLPGAAVAAGNLLDAIAMAGGTGNYLSPADPAALKAALAQIAGDTVDQCTFTLDPAPADPSMVHLIVTDATHPDGYEISEVDAGPGWSLGADGVTATLLGSVCNKAKNGTYTSINFVFGCPKLPG